MKKATGILLSVSFLWMIGSSGCAYKPASPSGMNIVHTGEQKCTEFMQAVPPAQLLYFTGQSKFRTDVNESKNLAFQGAQTAVALSIKSKISSACRETSHYKATSKKTTKRMAQECKTVIETGSIDVSSISMQTEYCLEVKKFTTAGKRKTAYRQTARIKIPEEVFTAFVKKQIRQ
ncbi:MAG: hypothetical protein GY866_39055 [Proteobacteria bacterium]|nr:hypothetical protein [Pseudomonadota bacterium]